jgi:hypothetical protein
MHKALVLSVPGTGTRFTSNYLEGCLGYTRVSPDDLIHKPPDSPFTSQCHVNTGPPMMKMLAEHRGLKTIIPLRAPVHQFITRCGSSAHANRVLTESKTLWARLRQEMGRFDFVFLPIEEDIDRDARLRLVTKHLDANPHPEVHEEIVKSWDKVGSNGVKAERVQWDATGHLNLGGKNMHVFDEEMKWYQEQIDQYRAAL